MAGLGGRGQTHRSGRICRGRGLVCTGVSGPPALMARIGHKGPAPTGQRAAPGTHAGPARLQAKETGGGRQGRAFAPLLLLALGITAAVVAWGYLVFLAIDLGKSARNGEDAA